MFTVDGESSFESNLPRNLKVELFIDDKLVIDEVEEYRTYAPKPFVRVPLPQGSTKLIVRISRRTGKEITSVGDIGHSERNTAEKAESPWRPAGF